MLWMFRFLCELTENQYQESFESSLSLKEDVSLIKGLLLGKKKTFWHRKGIFGIRETFDQQHHSFNLDKDLEEIILSCRHLVDE